MSEHCPFCKYALQEPVLALNRTLADMAARGDEQAIKYTAEILGLLLQDARDNLDTTHEWTPEAKL